MISENEKKAMRLLIVKNPKVDYMEQLAASDDFALSEVYSKRLILIEDRQGALIQLQNQVNVINSEIEKLNSEIALLEALA